MQSADPHQATVSVMRSDFIASAPNATSWPGHGELPECDIYEISTQALGARARRSPGHDLLTELVTQGAGEML